MTGKVLGLMSVEEVTTPKRRRSEIRHSEKQGLERFRTFAEQLHEKREFERQKYKSRLRNKRPDLSGRPPCKGVPLCR